MKFILSTLLALFLFVLNAKTQTTIRGVVMDYETKEFLPGANIFLQSDWSIGTTTDAQGKFQLQISKSLDTDTLIISYIGYQEKSIPVNGNSNQTLEIRLTPFAQLLEESVVTARRIIAEEFTVKQMKQLDIYLNPAAKADALLAINAMPSSTTTDESASISLRGSRPDETGIFLNDVPVYDAIRFSQLDGIGTFSIFNTEIIERMHVFAGNPPLEYGNTSSGLVSLQTKNDIPDESSNSISLSLANIGGLTSQRFGENTSLTAFGNYQPSKIIIGLNQDALRDLESFNSYDLGLHLTHQVNSKIRFKLFNYSNSEGYKFNSRVPSYTGIFDMYKTRNFTIANFIAQKEKSEFTINTGYNISKERYNFSITDIEIHKQDFFLSATYQHFYDQWSIKGGVSYDYRINRSEGSKPMFNFAQNEDHPSINFLAIEEYNLPELFLYTKFNLTEKLILGTGVRKNIVIGHTPNYLSYQGNLNYKINSKHNFNLSAGHYNRLSMPNAEQYKITHFRGNQYSLDYSYTGHKIEIQSSIFKKKVQHSNFEDHIIGGEIYTKLNIKPFELQLSLTSLDVKINNGLVNYPSKYDLDYYIRSVIKYRIDNSFEISAIYSYRQGSYYLPVEQSNFDNFTQSYYPVYSSWDQAKRLPDYQKLDLTASKYWAVNSNLAFILYANLSNALNSDNVMKVNYNSDYSNSFYELYSQRTWYFGISIIF